MIAKAGTVGVGVWGLGRHARRNILPALAACPTTTLLGVTTRNPTVAEGEAELHGCNFWPNPETMLRDRAVDAVYVSTPTGLHHAHGMAVLGSGKHLWSEKALANTLELALELVHESRVRDLAICEGLMHLYHPQFAFIADAIADASFGRVLSVGCQFGLPHLEQPGFRFSRELGGGALLDLGTYPVSAALRLLGPRLKLVESAVVQPSGFDVDTHGFALMTGDGGARAFLEWGYDRAYKNEISVWGENACLHSDFVFSKPADHDARVTLRDKHGSVTSHQIKPADSFSEMFRVFSMALDDRGLCERLRLEAELQATHLDELRRHD